jgi:Zona pellucida-like domain
MNSTHLTYSNVVRYSVPYQSSVITRNEVYYITVSCVLPRQADPINNVVSDGRTPDPQTGGGLFNVQLILFTDNHFQVKSAGLYSKFLRQVAQC